MIAAIGKIGLGHSLASVALPALAATPDAALPELNGAELSLLWGLPFAGLLLSIAVVPLFAAHFWHEHYGKVAAAWALAFLSCSRCSRSRAASACAVRSPGRLHLTLASVRWALPWRA